MLYGSFSKKSIRLIATFVVLAMITPTMAPLSRSAKAQDNILRLHILANSDSPADQRVKLVVRDAVLQVLPACGSAEEAEAYLLTHGGEVLTLAEQTLQDNGFDYGAQLLLGRWDFPDREYSGTTYPAGEYAALRIVLGEGAGQNWWCVLFPPLCIVTREQEPLPDPEELEFESSILNWFRSKEDPA